MIDPTLYPWLAALFGLLLGSFLNVCISRLPDDYSIVAPRSQCPRCGSAIAAHDNIPLLSFVLLGGRCRSCRAPISFRYPAVELLTAALFCFIVFREGASWAAVKWCVFAAILVELIFSDWETLILPDEFSKWGIALGITFAAIVPLPRTLPSALLWMFYPQAGEGVASVVSAIAGAGILAGGLWLLGAAYQWVRGREGLGFGDVKMVAFLGAFMGLEPALLGIMAGSLLGSVIGLIWMKLSGKDAAHFELPFGSFLGIGALLVAYSLL